MGLEVCDGHGYGDAYCYGYSYGDGEGYGYGDGDGHGYGDAYCYGHAYGCRHGYGYGYGDGEGYAHGVVDGSGYGYGYGYSESEPISIPEDRAWTAYHYIRQDKDGAYRSRNGKMVEVGQHLHEPEIEMCVRGLHASLSAEDASQYKPHEDAALTIVKVWGAVHVRNDKLVATDRMIVEEL
jgi:hypothetical protein